jgi:hypothetical protein
MGQDAGYPALNFDYNGEQTFMDGMLVNQHVKCVLSVCALMWLTSGVVA